MSNQIPPAQASDEPMLLPCPLCGNQPKLADMAGWEIVCQCGVNLCLATATIAPLIAAWNSRAALKAQPDPTEAQGWDIDDLISDMGMAGEVEAARAEMKGMMLADIGEVSQLIAVRVNSLAPNAELRAAAAAVVARWDTPKWKDEAPTADFIARLRKALELEPVPAQGEDSARLDATCGCRACNKEMVGRWFFACQVCGNKRCPHATDHALACTSSNEPGQIGSAYEHSARASAETGGVKS